MAATQTVTSNETVDSAIGPLLVVQATLANFDIDDYVQTTVVSLATAIKIYNMANNVNTQAAANRPIVNIGGVTVGGF